MDWEGAFLLCTPSFPPTIHAASFSTPQGYVDKVEEWLDGRLYLPGIRFEPSLKITKYLPKCQPFSPYFLNLARYPHKVPYGSFCPTGLDSADVSTWEKTAWLSKSLTNSGTPQFSSYPDSPLEKGISPSNIPPTFQNLSEIPKHQDRLHQRM